MVFFKAFKGCDEVNCPSSLNESVLDLQGHFTVYTQAPYMNNPCDFLFQLVVDPFIKPQIFAP